MIIVHCSECTWCRVYLTGCGWTSASALIVSSWNLQCANAQLQVRCGNAQQSPAAASDFQEHRAPPQCYRAGAVGRGPAAAACIWPGAPSRVLFGRLQLGSCVGLGPSSSGAGRGRGAPAGLALICGVRRGHRRYHTAHNRPACTTTTSACTTYAYGHAMVRYALLRRCR